jgi:hypothetical protein
MKLRGLAHITLAYIVTVGVAWATLEALGQRPYLGYVLGGYRSDPCDLYF